MTDFDVIVAGAGPAGLAAACLVAQNGKRAALIAGPAAADPRTVALMQPSIRLLSKLDLWPGTLRGQTAQLKRLRLVDDTGSTLRAPTITFDAAELGEEEFGWNIPLALLVPAFEARARELGVNIIAAEATGAEATASEIMVRLSTGEAVTGKLVLAADGRNSGLREAAGIKTNDWSYDQVAIATSFAHSASHDGMSTEYQRAAGPCTTVPLPGGRSSLVWMERPTRAAELMALADEDLAREIQLANHGDLGLVSAVGPRRAFPMKGLVARDFARNRTMLVGEAGHVVPPIGAQGLNMSLRDAAQAADIIAAAANDPGAADCLKKYDALRRRDIQPRQQIIDLMNRSLLSGLVVFEGARAAGLSLLGQFGPLRRYVMWRGLGPVSDLPRAMRG